MHRRRKRRRSGSRRRVCRWRRANRLHQRRSRNRAHSLHARRPSMPARSALSAHTTPCVRALVARSEAAVKCCGDARVLPTPRWHDRSRSARRLEDRPLLDPRTTCVAADHERHQARTRDQRPEREHPPSRPLTPGPPRLMAYLRGRNRLYRGGVIKEIGPPVKHSLPGCRGEQETPPSPSPHERLRETTRPMSSRRPSRVGRRALRQRGPRTEARALGPGRRDSARGAPAPGGTARRPARAHPARRP